jgi:hypothetical protein
MGSNQAALRASGTGAKEIKMDASQIMGTADNQAVLTEFFKGVASCDYYDGMSYQLYIDLDDMSLSINQEVSDQSWLQRDDGSLVKIASVSGYTDTPEDERYTDGCDIMDYGYAEWILEIEEKISNAIAA